MKDLVANNFRSNLNHSIHSTCSTALFRGISNVLAILISYVHSSISNVIFSPLSGAVINV